MWCIILFLYPRGKYFQFWWFFLSYNSPWCIDVEMLWRRIPLLFQTSAKLIFDCSSAIISICLSCLICHSPLVCYHFIIYSFSGSFTVLVCKTTIYTILRCEKNPLPSFSYSLLAISISCRILYVAVNILFLIVLSLLIVQSNTLWYLSYEMKQTSGLFWACQQWWL